MIDIHLHCLPDVDDGPEGIEEAVAICRAAALDGCQTLVATPHQRTDRWWNCDPGELSTKLNTLQKALGPSPVIHPGAEIRIDSGLLDSLGKPGRDGLFPLAGTSYLLLEFDRMGMTVEPRALAHELTLSGWRPIFAHPEFIPGLGENLALMQRLVEQGAYFQLTAASVIGSFGHRAKKIADRILRERLAHFIASDAHDIRYRPPGLRAAAKLVAAKYGEEYARQLTIENPGAVLADLPISERAYATG